MITKQTRICAGLFLVTLSIASFLIWLSQRGGEKVLFVDSQRALFSVPKTDQKTMAWLLGSTDVPRHLQGTSICVVAADGFLVIRQYDLGRRTAPFDAFWFQAPYVTGATVVRIPLLLVAFTCAGVIVVNAICSKLKSYFQIALGKCIICGYDLHGLPSSRCPECGTDNPVTRENSAAVPPENSIRGGN